MSSKQKKIIGTAAAVILVLALGLAGTFAASGSTNSSGNVEGNVDTSIFLHDDFSTDWDGDVRDRDVYVENTGDSALYVRMRLDEFMQYGGKKLVGGDKNLKSTWKPHKPSGTDVTECGSEIHDYFMLKLGNNLGVKYKPQTKNAYDPVIAEGDKTETTSAAAVVTIEDYLQAEEKPDPCWILDTADGYAYWHTQLQKGKATGLILNSITNTGLIDESYYYGINAKAEAVTELDLNAWFWGQAPKDSTTGEAFDQASTNAIRLLKNMSPKYIEVTQEMKDNGASDFDTDNDGYLTKQENADYEAEKGVTSTPKPELTLKERVKATDVGGVLEIANKDGSRTKWIVYDKTANEADMITKDCMTSKVYQAGSTGTPFPGWLNSDIRTWLNDGSNGYKAQLSEDMKAAIKAQSLTTASTFDNWVTTQDSTDEIYLLTETGDGTGKVGKTIGASTTLTAEQMMCSSTAVDGSSSVNWWLRSPRSLANYAGKVSGSTGDVLYNAVYNMGGIRPALTIGLE